MTTATNFHLYYPFSAEGVALCVCKRLQWLSSPRNTGVLRENHRRWFEFGICCVLPLISIPIRMYLKESLSPWVTTQLPMFEGYSVASNRYMILEGLGCISASYPARLSVFLICGPQLLIVCIAFIYACKTPLACWLLRSTDLLELGMAVWNLTRTQMYNTQFRRTKPEYIQLLAVCACTGVWPLIAVLLCLNSLAGLSFPWPGWNVVHRYFHLIPKLPFILQPAILRDAFMTILWVDIATAYFVFAVFAGAKNVRDDIRRPWNFLTRKISRLQCGRRGDATSAPSSQWLDTSSGTESKRSLLATLVAGVRRVSPLARHESSSSMEA